MRYGFVIDQDRCIACHACTVACKAEHNVPVGVFRTWVKHVEKGAFPNASRHFGVLRCNHCDNAPCVEICPTRALFYRRDRIVDFDNARCIGCESCMQACPYDALYLDPNTRTAAKCNFCAHRIELDLEPACVIVCPTQAIIAGDLDDPASLPSRIVATAKASVRKPHKGTRPKLFYVGIDGALLDPNALAHGDAYMWSEKPDGALAGANDAASIPGAGPAREVYDVTHTAPWGWKIAAYLWTKSISAGVLLVAALVAVLGYDLSSPMLSAASPALALMFAGVTGLLLIADLKRPERFYYVLVKPNPRSWLVIGAYLLAIYGALGAAWLLWGVVGGAPPGVLVAASAIFAAAAAGYSAFLFAQAEGRELWHSALFFWHLLAHSFITGAAALTIIAPVIGAAARLRLTLDAILLVSIALSVAMVLVEMWLPPASEEVRRAVRVITTGALRAHFWLGVVVLGGLVPVILLAAALAGGFSAAATVASILALGGCWMFYALWIKAGQAVPIS